MDMDSSMKRRFSGRALRAMMLPLFAEQLLVMKVSLASTIGGRLFLSYVLGVVMDMGVIGLAWAMAADWTIRAFLFLWRERTGKWREFQVI